MHDRKEWKKQKIRQLVSSWINCKKCNLHKTRKNIVFGYGDLNADIVAIGIGPGKEEDEIGDPFVGKSGLIINDYLNVIKMPRDEIFFMNIVSCRPFSTITDSTTGRKKEENRDPSLIEREACRPLWQEMLYIVDPLLIIAFGKPAILEITNRRSVVMNDVQGIIDNCIIPGKINNITYPIMSMYHPAYLARTGDKSRGGPWHKTMVAWRRVAYFIDQLRYLQRDVPIPDRGYERKQMFMIEKGV